MQPAALSQVGCYKLERSGSLEPGTPPPPPSRLLHYLHHACVASIAAVLTLCRLHIHEPPRWCALARIANFDLDSPPSLSGAVPVGRVSCLVANASSVAAMGTVHQKTGLRFQVRG